MMGYYSIIKRNKLLIHANNMDEPQNHHAKCEKPSKVKNRIRVSTLAASINIDSTESLSQSHWTRKKASKLKRKK